MTDQPTFEGLLALLEPYRPGLLYAYAERLKKAHEALPRYVSYHGGLLASALGDVVKWSDVTALIGAGEREGK